MGYIVPPLISPLRVCVCVFVCVCVRAEAEHVCVRIVPLYDGNLMLCVLSDHVGIAKCGLMIM